MGFIGERETYVSVNGGPACCVTRGFVLAVAQLVERWDVAPVVASSTLVGQPIFSVVAQLAERSVLARKVPSSTLGHGAILLHHQCDSGMIEVWTT